ncbi:hypothetical protein PAMP_023791 [Pampus punctatissimus]
MRHWLDVADDEMTVLRSDNAALRKQISLCVCSLEKMVSDAQQVEAEPCRSLLADDPDVKRCSEKDIQKLVKSLQQQTEQDKNSLNKLSVAYHTLEFGIEEAQLGLQHKEEVINQKNLLLKHAEETVEECSNIIKDLKQTNQELRKQLENQQDEASLCAGTLETAVQKAGLFVLCILTLTVLAFVASGSCAGDFFSINTFWSGARLMLQPYCSVHYGALPPI